MEIITVPQILIDIKLKIEKTFFICNIPSNSASLRCAFYVYDPKGCLKQ